MTTKPIDDELKEKRVNEPNAIIKTKPITNESIDEPSPTSRRLTTIEFVLMPSFENRYQRLLDIPSRQSNDGKKNIARIIITSDEAV